MDSVMPLRTTHALAIGSGRTIAGAEAIDMILPRTGSNAHSNLNIYMLMSNACSGKALYGKRPRTGIALADEGFSEVTHRTPEIPSCTLNSRRAHDSWQSTVATRAKATPATFELREKREARPAPTGISWPRL
jgi:hypothetical protein